MEEMADQGTEEVLKEEPEQAPPWKQDSILGWTVDFELYASIYGTNIRLKNQTSHPQPYGRAPGLVPRLSVA